MHLVFLNQYYPPDVAPTGVMLEGLVGALVEGGHEVTVLCASGGYAGPASGGSVPSIQNSTPPRIIRIGATRYGRGTVFGKLLDYASYYLGVGWKLATMKPRPERVVALTTPPYLSVLARVVSKFRRADHAHWVMDLYPDVMAAHGMLGNRSPVYRLLEWLARWGLGGARCAAVMTLGPDMAVKLGRYVPESRRNGVQWVPLWGEKFAGFQCSVFSEEDTGKVIGDQLSVISGEGGKTTANEPFIGFEAHRASEQAAALRKDRGWGDEELVVMYSGNMGLGHRFSEIFEAARRLSGSISQNSKFKIQNPRSIRFVFFGGGKRRAEVEELVDAAPECRVELHEYAAAADLAAHLRSADVHLASLDPAWTGTMVPSKLQGIFASGRPVVFVGSGESSIGQWVTQSGGGWVVEAGDVDGLLVALAEAGDPEQRATRGQAAKSFADTHFDKQANAARIAALIA